MVRARVGSAGQGGGTKGCTACMYARGGAQSDHLVSLLAVLYCFDWRALCSRSGDSLKKNKRERGKRGQEKKRNSKCQLCR